MASDRTQDAHSIPRQIMCTLPGPSERPECLIVVRRINSGSRARTARAIAWRRTFRSGRRDYRDKTDGIHDVDQCRSVLFVRSSGKSCGFNENLLSQQDTT